MDTTKIKTSGFALIDITRGRLQLAASLSGKNKEGPPTEGFPICIKGFVTRQWGGHDGTSIEFEIEVTDFHIDPLRAMG